jgi:hypothetical protein
MANPQRNTLDIDIFEVDGGTGIMSPQMPELIIFSYDRKQALDDLLPTIEALTRLNQNHGSPAIAYIASAGGDQSRLDISDLDYGHHRLVLREARRERRVWAAGAVPQLAEIASRNSQQMIGTAGQAVQQTAAAASDATYRNHDAVSRVLTAEGDLASFWLELVSEQVAHNIETFQKLATTGNWREALEIRDTFIRDSFERMGRLNGRYLETVQTMVTATSLADEDQAGKAA